MSCTNNTVLSSGGRTQIPGAQARRSDTAADGANQRTEWENLQSLISERKEEKERKKRRGVSAAKPLLTDSFLVGALGAPVCVLLRKK